jgi:hypothetical protein
MAVPQNRPQTTLETPAALQPVYANLVRIAHSPADIVLDFAHLLPGESRAMVGARILMSPLSAKLLLRALNENLARYDCAFARQTPSNLNYSPHFGAIFHGFLAVSSHFGLAI